MIALQALDLAQRDLHELDLLHAQVMAAGGYAEQVTSAKARWASKPARLFESVRRELESLCSGNRRCVYCEDSLADEIEHMRPKDLYPEQCFRWPNYVFACGPCNGPKNNRFGVMADAGGVIEVTRRRGDPVVPPPAGQYALIDPRVEDPIDFLWLDFDSGVYDSNDDDDESVISQRARFTINLLGLNRRDDLLRGRRSAFHGFLARLHHYVERRDLLLPSEVESLRLSLLTERYLGVWERMKRYRERREDLLGLFDLAPEALQW